ncbi:MAG TPA: polymer-forming cytoskeletal protein [Steroidobacteraceae bacterium]|nr:polymer-forming cytoskeletal protein [Steroidobacteraceae bacterium]HNS28142.1 polymer-forming cytoskeletal protein [Steroidobacteraceae bacterium]
MSEQPRRRLLDQFGVSPTYIAEGSRIRGDIDTRGPFVLSGTLEGNARVGAGLSISVGARLHGDVEARSAVIAGEVIGNVTIEEKLEIGATAVIHGSIAAKSLAIANGAVIEGDIVVTGTQPVVKFDEKRRA